jgi:hypothetical protein
MGHDEDSSFTSTAPAEDLSVCDRCFGDPDIKEFIKGSADSFLCNFCGRRGRTNVLAAPLVDVVEFIISAVEREYERAINALGYESAEGGYLGAHWNSEELIDEIIGLEFPKDNGGELRTTIAECLGDEPWCQRNPYSLPDEDRYIYSWDDFCNHVKHERRYFFLETNRGATSDDDEKLSPSHLLRFIGSACEQHGLVKKYDTGTLLYRARQTKRGEHLISGRDFGPPPQRFAVQSNRMSPAGIVMFYCSDEVSTAVAETDNEPALGISVGTFATTRIMTLLDLAYLQRRFRFFESQSDSSEIDRDVLGFLHSFVTSIATKVERGNREHVDYVPPQVVTEWFRTVFLYNELPIDGICYPSTQRPGGCSFVLFADQEAIVLRAAEIKKLSSSDPLGEWWVRDRQKSAWLRLIRRRVIREAK